MIDLLWFVLYELLLGQALRGPGNLILKLLGRGNQADRYGSDAEAWLAGFLFWLSVAALFTVAALLSPAAPA